MTPGVGRENSKHGPDRQFQFAVRRRCHANRGEVQAFGELKEILQFGMPRDERMERGLYIGPGTGLKDVWRLDAHSDGRLQDPQKRARQEAVVERALAEFSLTAPFFELRHSPRMTHPCLPRVDHQSAPFFVRSSAVLCLVARDPRRADDSVAAHFINDLPATGVDNYPPALIPPPRGMISFLGGQLYSGRGGQFPVSAEGILPEIGSKPTTIWHFSQAESSKNSGWPH